jgi:hypothetical protein
MVADRSYAGSCALVDPPDRRPFCGSARSDIRSRSGELLGAEASAGEKGVIEESSTHRAKAAQDLTTPKEGAGMRKLLASAVIIPAVIAAFSWPATAQPKHTDSKFFFDGTTAQGQELFFVVENIGGIRYWEPFFTGFQINCPDGNSFTFSWIFFGFQIPLGANGEFSVVFTGDQIPFGWHGRVNDLNAHGGQYQGYAAYDVNGNVQDCATGNVTWSAQGIGSAPKAPHGGSRHYTVTLVKQDNGKIRQTVTVTK